MTVSGLTGRKTNIAMLPVVASLTMALSIAVVRAQTAEQKPQVDGRMVVTGEGRVAVAPDQVQISGGVTTSAKTVKEASGANSKVMAAIVAAILESGIAEKDIQTSQFSIEPVYTSQSSSEPAKLTGYRVSNQVNVKLREVSQVGDILDRLIKAGATDVGNIVFLVSDSERALDQAREAALADARRKAELYARAAGVRLRRVAWITETSNYMPVGPTGILAQRQEKPVPIERGEQTLRANITVGFDIAQ
jgi:uncharacterized protein YggE